MSKIQWTERTWNPVVGCSIVSPGCTNCYAMRQAARLLDKPGSHYEATTRVVNGQPVWTGKVALAPDHILTEPLRRKKPTTYFVNSMGDLFHKDVPYPWQVYVFAVMEAARKHTLQVLTKRPDRQQKFMQIAGPAVRKVGIDTLISKGYRTGHWPPPNIWLGTSVEDRLHKYRIDLLRKTPAAVRFLSLEPLLEDLGDIDLTGIHWVIVGGESGPGARPMEAVWARRIVAQCRDAGVPVFVKQLGAAYSEPENGVAGAALAVPPEAAPLIRRRLKDRKGGDTSEWPEDLRVREMPVGTPP